MAAMKQYLLTLLERCSDQQFGQDAIEHAIATGLVPLTYQLETDITAITQLYDVIVEYYQSYNLARQTYEDTKVVIDKIMEVA